jgi:hypothetical protein
MMSVPENELTQQPQQPPAPVGLSMADVEARLAARDQNLLNTVSEVLANAFEQFMPNRQQREQEVQQGRDARPASVTKEDFEHDPVAAMEKFTNAKMQGLAHAIAQQPPQDPAARLALIELRKREFYEQLPPEDHVFIPFFEKYILDLSPGNLIDPRGLDQAWRVNKSYATDYINQKEQERIYRMEQAQLAQSGGQPRPRVRARLDPLEQGHAQRMGVTPEDYVDYSAPQIIDI